MIADNPVQRNYGVAVTDVDGDGAFELFVAGFGSRNLVLTWTGSGLVDIADAVLADAGGQAIGVAAGDVDGDGLEELYVLNTDTFAGPKRDGDRLFARRGPGWADLFELGVNDGAANVTAGRSVACIDRMGSGSYGFFVANYGGAMRLYELAGERILDLAPEAGVAAVTGGRAVLAGPIAGTRTDLLAANEHGPNLLFRNLGDGHFEEVAARLGLDDPDEHGRGVALVDMDGLGLVCGNWEGPHRLYRRSGRGATLRFKDVAPPELARPSRVRTVIAADFDNDGHQELFFNNIGEPNRLFGWRDGAWRPLDLGAAVEPDALGTGAAVADLDGDGRLELLVAHGESMAEPLSLFYVPANANAWLRVLPLTPAGAPARGALVSLWAGGRVQRRVVDAGSGYLCQMEPVAHFGLGAERSVDKIEVRWPDRCTVSVEAPEPCQLLRVEHPAVRHA